MESKRYQGWLEDIDALSEAQRSEVRAILAGRTSEAEVIAALEVRLLADRCCAHCQQAGVIVRGTANGLRRFYCKACGKTFNALTGTPLAHLHYKGRWVDFAKSLSARETVRKSASRCTLAVSTAFRWRHRFLGAIKTDTAVLGGIVEADETYVLESRKPSREWQRAEPENIGAEAPARGPRKRAGKASKRGLSAEQVPVLVAADRTGATVSAILPNVTAEAIGDVLER
jgi:transposase-like protein